MKPQSKMPNLFLRAMSSAVLIPLVLWMNYSSKKTFCLFMLLVTILMAVEWRGIISHHKKHKFFWTLGAATYIFSFFFSFLFLRFLQNGSNALLWLMITVWSADTAAFISGKLLGGPKFAPKISPAKTWAGFCGAVSVSFFVGFAFILFLSKQGGALFVSTTVLLGALAQFSDLLESWIKRKAGIKDSGSLIPGHGGILDRTDSFILTAPALALLLLFFENLYF